MGASKYFKDIARELNIKITCANFSGETLREKAIDLYAPMYSEKNESEGKKRLRALLNKSKKGNWSKTFTSEEQQELMNIINHSDFSDPPAGLRLFEKLHQDDNIMGTGSAKPDSYKLLLHFPEQKQFIVFFEDGDETFIVENFQQLIDIYEIFYKTVYLTDLNMSFIIFCSCEESLGAGGAAFDWLENLLKSQ